MKLIIYFAGLIFFAWLTDISSQSVLYAVVCPMLACVFLFAVFVRLSAMKTANTKSNSDGGTTGGIFGGSDGGCGGDGGGGGDGGC